MTSRNENLVFEIFDKNNELGKSEVPLDSIQNQEEYDLDLEITDKSEKVVLMVLHTKTTFIWSYYQKYDELSSQINKKLESIQNVHEKTKKILTDLDKPFNLLNFELEKQKGDKSEYEIFKTHPKEFEYADMIHNHISITLRDRLKIKEVKWLSFIKIFLYILIVISFFNMFVKADFINMMIPIYILATLSTSMSDKMLVNLQIFVTASAVTLITDLLWLLFRDSTNVADAGGENSIRRIVYFTSLVSFVVKILVTISLWVVKLKVQRGHKEVLI
jgi:hypothetical protein